MLHLVSVDPQGDAQETEEDQPGFSEHRALNPSVTARAVSAAQRNKAIEKTPVPHPRSEVTKVQQKQVPSEKKPDANINARI